MLLDMVIMLTIASTAVEGFIAWNVPGWLEMTEKMGRWGKIFDISFSFFLSWMLGILFQAPSSVVIMMAAIASTVVSMPMYPIMRWAKAHIEEIRQAYAKVRQTTIDVCILIYKVLRLLTIPIRVSRWMHQQYQAVKIGFKSV